MRIKQTLITAALCLLLVACSAPANATQVFNEASGGNPLSIPVTSDIEFGSCGGPVISTINPEFEQAVIEQTNEIRMTHGLPPLKAQEDLGKSARYHTADMSATNYFSHDTMSRIDGDMVTVCDTWQRIEVYYPNWLALAENIAAGQRTPEMALDGWMNSPDHRENILSDNYSEIGVGYYQGEGDYRIYWGQNFGRRAGVYPLVIEGEKAVTNSTNVYVYIHGNFSAMRLRNDDGEWSGWVPFVNGFDWILLPEPGMHTVSAQLRGPDGEYTTSDTIELVIP